MTRAQREVLDALTHAPAFASAQQIHAQLRNTGSRIGLTSVYRALQSLSDDGLVDVLRSDAGEATYRRCGSTHHHHHLICRTCGATVEVEAPRLERWVADIAQQHGYAVDDHTLEIRGTCSRCTSQ
jgi:Fur family ferric uptake transcriptional regulator